MVEPRVPGTPHDVVPLDCGESTSLDEFDMGMREYACGCGASHAVVTDVHPLSRWVPESIVDVLRESIGTTDEFDEFTQLHLMGIVLEEFPDRVTVVDCTEEPDVGYAMLWVSDFDSRRLHEIVVELLVELMDHAVSHADDEEAVSRFEEQLHSFDVGAFVDEYRSTRDFEDEYDVPT